MTRKRLLLAALGANLLIVIPVLAAQVAPRLVSAAQGCGVLTPGTLELVIGVGDLTGTVTRNNFSVDVTNSNGSVSFSNASAPVRAALVTGAGDGNYYDYDGTPVRADSGLVAPEGQAITKVSLCYVQEASASGAGASASTSTGGAAASSTGGSSASSGSTLPPTDTDNHVTPAPDRGIALVVAGVLLAGAGVALAVRPRRDRARGRG